MYFLFIVCSIMLTINQLLNNFRKRKIKRNKLIALANAPQRRGVVYKLAIMSPRKPNSAKRKIAKVRVIFNKHRIFASIPGMGHNLHEYSVVMMRGGSANDLPGVNYTLIRGVLDFSYKETFSREARRSKYGVKLKDTIRYKVKISRINKS
ncbi:ribosomal protein S12, mitochondrial-like [Schistocerca gregaria]|uniref:ribosomal protein S12, mitochondrial-like n=1 Tax=Schistocerca gregaria TaxID=7010 RepID=UPI00211EAAD6|nr:ribosomal protein S12, mitochondrial-like [Schistocerca gregaria]XP_049850328.1 ribosomal protein S12, mitochondrial-like [Schistocerca gregaria]XP_049852344.1 ribosomal protein S12, mitochondrial-like [Schistocerca gregaria]XP_049852757.1 ribosomal protein S12, mitochondrial-like [Schistocerca gregaria]